MIDVLPLLLAVLIVQLVLAVYLLIGTRSKQDEKPKRKRKNDELDQVQQATGLKGGYIVAGEIKIPFGDERRRVLNLFELRRTEERNRAHDWFIAPSRITIEEIPARQWKSEIERRQFFAQLRVSDSVPDERPAPFPTKRMK